MVYARQETRQELVGRAKSVDELASRYDSVYYYALRFLPGFGSRLRKVLPHIEGPRVLEVSFGTGYLMSHYAARFETVGVDYNRRYVENTQRRLAKRSIPATLLQEDAHNLPFADASFNTLINTDALTLYDDPDKVMAEFYRVLLPGGRLLLMEYNLPKNRNWMGMRMIQLSRAMKYPYVDLDAVLQKAGFQYEDRDVGGYGTLHFYIATKPADAR